MVTTNRLSRPQIQIKKVLQDTMEHNCCDIHWIAFCWCNPTKISSNWYELPLKTGFEKLKMFLRWLFDSKILGLYELLPFRV